MSVEKIKLRVTYKGEVRTVVVDEGSSIEDLLRSLHLYVDAHLVTSAGRPLPLTNLLRNGQELAIIQVASGG